MPYFTPDSTAPTR